MIAPTYTGFSMSKPTTMPVSLTEAKRQLRLDEITTDDDHVRLLIQGVCDNIERTYQHAMITKTITEFHSAFPCFSTDALLLSVRPGIAVTSVSYIDSAGATQVFSSSDYTVKVSSQGMFIVPDVDAVWPTDLAIRPDAVTIVYTAGYGTDTNSIPASMRLAVLNLIGKYDANREDAVTEKTAASDILLASFFHNNA